ncbi:MAG TPA: MurR/RpiR family transcriptional regulator [Clostridiaceae bacterium]|nr:MurR/RpiR family transcriptional regulator [Clostridiaceae bacterium]
MKNSHQLPTIIKIESLFDKLSKSDKKICSYILENINSIIRLTITEVAENTNTSEATVVRTCRKLGYRGFQDFKISLAQEISTPIETIFSEASETDTCFDIYCKEIESITSTLQLTKAILDKDSLEAAAEAIRSCNRMVVYGVGNSAAIAADFAHKMTRAGIYCVSYSDSHMQTITATGLKKGDVAVGISHSGSSRDVVEALQLSKKYGATTICITNYGSSPITKVSDIALFTSSEEVKHRIMGLSSRFAQLAIIDSIYIYISLKDSEGAFTRVNRIEKELQSKKY